MHPYGAWAESIYPVPHSPHQEKNTVSPAIMLRRPHETHNSTEPPIFIDRHSRPCEPLSEPAESSNDSHGWPETFLTDFESKIWITYRSSFPPIPRPDSRGGTSSMTFSVRLRSQFTESNGFTSDTGWGCMIRSGQSLLANALSILILGRGIALISSMLY